jgi:hypothetical protein
LTRWLTRLKTPPSETVINFCNEHSLKYDMSALRRVRVLRGRKHFGAYGWMECESRKDNKLICEIALHLPGPFPHVVSILRKPITRKILGLELPEDVYTISRNVSVTSEEVRISLRSKTTLHDQDEAAAWLYGHEFFHYLTSSGQSNKPDTEYNADAYGNFLLECWRTL